MVIAGFQKTTLLDYPDHIASIVFTAGCNMRCPYCHNAALVLTPNDINTISADEVYAHMRKRRGIIEGLVISGGEPTLHSDLPDFIRKIKDLGVLVKLDTNGTNPQMLRLLLEENLLDYVAMDIKYSKALYNKIAGENILSDNTESCLSLLKQSNIDYELRTTITIEHFNDRIIEEIALWLKGHTKWFLQPYKDAEFTVGGHFTTPTDSDMLRFKAIAEKYISTEIRG